MSFFPTGIVLVGHFQQSDGNWVIFAGIQKKIIQTFIISLHDILNKWNLNIERTIVLNHSKKKKVCLGENLKNLF